MLLAELTVRKVTVIIIIVPAPIVKINRKFP